MRVKEQSIVVSFKNTNDAMAVEAHCEGVLKGRLIPLPPCIHAGCGLAWKCHPDDKLTLLKLLQSKQLAYDEIYELMI